MTLERENIDLIREGFAKMRSREDFVILLNEAKKILYGDEVRPVSLKAITYYANPTIAKQRYKVFAIKKKSGGERKIHAPVRGLKSIQRALNLILQCVFEPNQAATGFIRGKSIVDNAKMHAGHHYIYSIDLKDFFPSIELHRVKACFKLPPFNLTEEREPLAFLLANLCCTPLEVERLKDYVWIKEIRPVLPQGAPTSPTITNIVAQQLDRKLTGLAKRFNVIYSRYADDITFSSYHNVYQKDGDFLNELQQIISSQNFLINPDKTRLQKSVYRQEVTGLVVNEKANIKRRYVKQLRMWLYYWEKYGYERAEQIFLKDYLSDKGHVKSGKPDFIHVINGKLEFLKMVVGSESKSYNKLNDQYQKLKKTTTDDVKFYKSSEDVLNLIFTKGLDYVIISDKVGHLFRSKPGQ